MVTLPHAYDLKATGGPELIDGSLYVYLAF